MIKTLFPNREQFNNIDEHSQYVLYRKILVDKYKNNKKIDTEEINTIALSMAKNINIENYIINSDLSWDELSKINKILLDKRIKFTNKVNRINLIIIES